MACGVSFGPPEECVRLGRSRRQTVLSIVSFRQEAFVKLAMKASILAGVAPLSLAGLLAGAIPAAGQDVGGGPCAGYEAQYNQAMQQLYTLDAQENDLRERYRDLEQTQSQYQATEPGDAAAKAAQLQQDLRQAQADRAAWTPDKGTAIRDDLDRRVASLQAALDLVQRIQRGETYGGYAASEQARAVYSQMAAVIQAKAPVRDQANAALKALRACQAEQTAAASAPTAPGETQAAGEPGGARPGCVSAPQEGGTPAGQPGHQHGAGGDTMASTEPGAGPSSVPSEPPPPPPSDSAPPPASGDQGGGAPPVDSGGQGGEPTTPAEPAAAAAAFAGSNLIGSWTVSTDGRAVDVTERKLGEYRLTATDPGRSRAPRSPLVVDGDRVTAVSWGMSGRLLDGGRTIHWDDGGWTGTDTVWTRR
jgi:hypothetical protein